MFMEMDEDIKKDIGEEKVNVRKRDPIGGASGWEWLCSGRSAIEINYAVLKAVD